ncbi:hypothetical protein FRC08_003777 [Ceratobasidium sp. 394]|nr:hypothetical protein FRC08_003777 [Ceratobasidium sp. 394]
MSKAGKWKNARTLLATTIQNYLAASTVLLTACAKPVYCPSERSEFEEILVTVESERRSLVSDENALQSMRMSLLTARNKSATMTPVNTLPPEILAHIFALSNTCYARNDKLNLHNFTGVCGYWRDIAINTIDPWTHIDVGPRVPQRLTKMLLDRTKNSPVHIHLYETTPELGSASPDCVFGVIQMFAPHMHRVCTVDLESYGYSPSLVIAILNLWLGSGSSSVAKSLTVSRPNASMPLLLNASSIDALGHRADNSRAVLQSLRRLHLENIRFDWGSAAYRGLVDLRLNYFCSPTSMPISQLANLLSASPELSVLKLGSLKITNPETWNYPAPIKLSCLHVLCLFCIDSASLRLLLPLITLSRSAKVCIRRTNFSDIYSELEDLVARSRVAELYCWQDKSRLSSTWWSLLHLPSCLCILGFREFLMRSITASEMDTTGSRSLLTPCLPNVLLLDCSIYEADLKALIAERSVQNLRLERCMIHHNSESVPVSLLKAHPGLQCTISEIVSKEWEHCSMFDG